MYWDQGGHAWGWVGMTIGMTLFWVLVVVVVVAATRWSVRSGELGPSTSNAGRPHGPVSARAVLDARLARGEIDVADYETRLAALERAGG